MTDLLSALLDRISTALGALSRRPEPLLVPVRADDRRAARLPARRP